MRHWFILSATLAAATFAALALGWQPARAAGVVTNCTSGALAAAMSGGGLVTFDCGPAPVTIPITQASGLGVTSGLSLTIDGGGKVTLSGADTNRIFFVDAGVFGTPITFTLRHITLTNGYANAEPGGCMLIGFSANVTLDDVTVQNCRTGSTGQGGGIDNSLGNLTVLNSRVLNNEAHTGGGVRNGFGLITVSNTLLSNNRAITGTGGGLEVAYGQAVITGSTFYSNSAVIGGGGIASEANTILRIAGSRIENNRARNAGGQTFGGGIRSAGALTISTTTITGNIANVGQSSTWGGGLYHEAGPLLLTDVLVQANRSIHGAGVQVASGSATINGVTFANNFATLASGDGGGLGTGGATVSLTGTVFSGNYAAREGGAINNRATLTVSNSILTGNGAYNAGGGILNWFGTAAIINSTVSGNNASGGGVGYGGGIFNRNASLTLTASTVCGNSAHYDGGGIFNDGTLTLNGATVCNNTTDGGDGIDIAYGGGGIFNAGTATVLNSTLSGNRTIQLDGGGFYNRNGTAAVSLSTISGNSAAQDGGGVKNEGGTVTLLHSTVSGNRATAWGGGVFSDFGQTNLRHVTLSGNAAIAGGGIYQLTTNPNLRLYLQNTLVANSTGANCAQFAGSLDALSGGYNLSDDNAFHAVSGFCPSFAATDLSNANDNLGPLANNGGPTRTHLPLPGSQAIDAIPIAANGCGTTFTIDQRGVGRPVNGDADPAIKCDIGAVEYVLGERTPWLYLPLIRR